MKEFEEKNKELLQEKQKDYQVDFGEDSDDADEEEEEELDL
jgi:hypothetical protein